MKFYLFQPARIKQPGARNINQSRLKFRQRQENLKRPLTHIWNIMPFLQELLPCSRSRLPFRRLQFLQRKDCSGISAWVFPVLEYFSLLREYFKPVRDDAKPGAAFTVNLRFNFWAALQYTG